MKKLSNIVKVKKKFLLNIKAKTRKTSRIEEAENEEIITSRSAKAASKSSSLTLVFYQEIWPY